MGSIPSALIMNRCSARVINNSDTEACNAPTEHMFFGFPICEVHAKKQYDVNVKELRHLYKRIDEMVNSLQILAKIINGD